MHTVTARWVAAWFGLLSLGVGARPADAWLHFDGAGNYVEIPNSEQFSVSTTGGLSVSAWMRPDTLAFPASEGSGYIHWLGKGERGQYEWVFRMYSQGNAEARQNRISFYVFNLVGGLGVGSYFQDPIRLGEWIHVVGVADGQRTSIYKNGRWRKSDVYQATIRPGHGTAPVRMGTRDFRSYFQGGLREVRIWGRALSAAEVAELYAAGRVPRDGLVAEYLLNEGAEEIAHDTGGAHHARIQGATWRADNPR